MILCNKRLLVRPECQTGAVQLLPDADPTMNPIGTILETTPGSNYKVGQRIAYNRADTVVIDGQPLTLVWEENVLVILG